MCRTKRPLALLAHRCPLPSPAVSSLWVLGAAGCALSPSFPILLLCRLAVGAACGPFIALAAPLIDDGAPPQQKSLWLASLFLCIPVGFALGYIFGGVVSAKVFCWSRAGRGVQHTCTGKPSIGGSGGLQCSTHALGQSMHAPHLTMLLSDGCLHCLRCLLFIVHPPAGGHRVWLACHLCY